MKKKILQSIAVLTIILAGGFWGMQKVHAEGWETVGDGGISEGQASFLSLAVNPTSGEPYIVSGSKVMRFTNGSWQTLGGASYSDNITAFSSLAFNPNSSQLYVAYSDYSNNDGYKATVKTFTNGSWQPVGEERFSEGGAWDVSFAINPQNNELYVAFNDGAHSSKATVMKYSNGMWQVVGNPGFTNSPNQGRGKLSLAINPSNGEPYLAYSYYDNSHKVTVMKFSGGSWISVGDSTFNLGSNNTISLAFNPNSLEPYLALCDGDNSQKATVMKFSGESWQAVGSPGLSGDGIGLISLAFNPINKEPYVAYSGGSAKATVMRYNDNSWQTVGNAEFSPRTFMYLSLAFNQNSGQPYVAFDDYNNSMRATVMKYVGDEYPIILKEDFEDSSTDSRISIINTDANSGIKDVDVFGSSKAFGFGRSSCGSNCFGNHTTTLTVALPEPTYVSELSFKDMELFENWGSDGRIYIDGQPYNKPDVGVNDFWGTFGRLPYNDRTADTSYRNNTIPINKVVQIIEIQSWDITNLSEIFIDDLIVRGGSSVPPPPAPKPTHKVAYIPVKFSDGTKDEYSVDQLKQRAKKVEEYYKQQSNNAVIIDSDFLSDNWIQLDKKLADFSGTGKEKWESILNYVTDDDFIKKIRPNFVSSDYKSIVVVQPECITSFVENVVDENNIPHAGKKLITSEKKSLATWSHELGHSLFQFGDYCDGGDKNTGVRFWDLMGAGTLMNPTVPLMSYNRIEKNWLGYEQQSYGTHSINYLSDNNYSGKPIRYDTPNNGDIDYYILEGRNPEVEFNDETMKDDTLVGKYCPDYKYDYKIEKEKGVLIYQVSEKENPNDNTKDKILALPHVNDGNNNIVTLKPGDNFINPKDQVKFSLAEKFGKPEVKVEEYPSNDEKIVSLKASYSVGDNQSIVGEVLPMDNQSDIDLHVVSLDGKRVGMNYETGEYENQIEGALTSYNIPGGGPEWISIPSNVNASYYVDTTPLKKWADETGSTVSEIEAQWQITTFDGNGNRTDSEEITTPIELDQENVPLAIDASVDASPKPLNSKTPGKWINVFVELPEKYDIQQADKDSILLNQKLKPSKIEVGDYDKDKIKDMTLQFDKQQVLKLFSDPNNKMLVIDGNVKYQGSVLPFEGSVNVGLSQEIIASFDSLKNLVNSSNINSGIKRVLLHEIAAARMFYERGNTKIMNRTLDRLKRQINMYSKNLMPKRLRISKDLADKMIVIIQKIKTL
jgi:hypothetical protein